MMANDTRVLLCLIEGETKSFQVTVPTDRSIYFLETVIWEECKSGPLRARDLVLWKLNTPVSARPAKTLAERINGLGELSQFAAELQEPVDSVLDVFPEQPTKDLLHIIVQKPLEPPPRELLRMTSPSPDPPPYSVERSHTVSALYQKLNLHRFIQVRGTPASGKSTLAKLLAQYIHVQEPGVCVIWIGGWKLGDVKGCGGWFSYLKTQKGWIPENATVFIFDEAQVSYEDGELWNELFKGIADYRGLRRAIVFASYGSPSSDFIIEGTPIFVAPEARVSLLPTAHSDNLPAVGLLFTGAEFNQLVSKQYPYSEYRLHSSFLNMVFGITEGHVGAICSFLNIILASDPYRELKRSGECYTWEVFQKTVDLALFFQQFESTGAGVFRRGLPPDRDLRAPAVACVFSSVLRTGSVQNTDFTTEDNISALQLCFRRGWLHTDNFDDEIKYFFPSWLHRWYIEWKLWGFRDITFRADDILDFVIEVIALFSPRILSTTRRVSAAGHVQRPPEAQYQDEFYRCCHTHSNGSLVTFPEFGTAKGRVDFYIPAKRWGVELLRDGDQLAQHSGRFSSQTGSYGTTLSLTDYIILDCRTTQPRARQAHLQKLYHIVFDAGFSQVKILDNELKVVPRGEFMLLASS